MGIKGFTPEELKEVDVALTYQRNILRGHFFPYTGVPKNKLTPDERTYVEGLLVRLSDIGSALDSVKEQIRRDEELTRRAAEDVVEILTKEDAKDYINKVSKRK